MNRSTLGIVAFLSVLPLTATFAQETGGGGTRAQAPRTVAFIADSVAAAGDTAAAITMLESALRTDKRNAATWHELGVLKWNQARSKRSGGVMKDQNAIRQLIAADSSLRMATKLAPDSARFWISLSKFNLTSGVSFARYASGQQALNAVDAAEKTGDTLLLAVSADEAGMAVWRRYEPVAKRALTTDGRPMQVSGSQFWRRDRAVDYLQSFVHRIEPPTGTADYTQAENLFKRALIADPTNLRTMRHYYMVLGERDRWEEMRAFALSRTRTYRFDWLSWMALGLAAHRLGDDKQAQVAFDSAMVLTDDGTRDRMTRLSRILRPSGTAEQKKRKDGIGDAKAFDTLPETSQRGIESLYWLMSDPLTLTAENEHRLEFLSRVTWADMRWTVEENNMFGTDTDRGDVFIRYGPPKLDMTMPGRADGGEGGTTIAWVYPNNLVFFFDLVPGFSVATTAFADKNYSEEVKNAIPVSWDNVPTSRMLDTIPIRVARFRSGQADSLDVVIAASIPLDSLVRGLEMARAPIDIDLRIFDRYVTVRGVESVQTMVAPDSAKTPASRSWIRRVGPGLNILRVEALQADSRRGARSMSRLDPDVTEGFGMSDILLGSAPAARGNGAPASWRDIAITPNIGSFPVAAPNVGLVWEIYQLSAKDGAAKYKVDIAIERVTKGVGGFGGRVVDAFGRTMGREVRGTNKLSMSFDRSVAPASKLVEFMSVNLAQASPGEYRLVVTITDLGTQAKTSRATNFRIR